MSLKKKATKGSIWTSLTRTGINVVDFLVYAYLARVLTLEEFGLAGFCFLFIEFANTLVNAGVNQNLVQRDKWEDRYAASTMTFVAGMGLVVVIGILGIGAPIAYYSYSELAAWVVASLAPITLVTSLQVVVSGKLLREFKNKQMGIAKFCATLISAATIIVLAESGYGLWSLIIGKLVNAIIQYILLIYVAKFKPYFHFNREDNKELIRDSHKGALVINQVTMSSINSMVVPSFSRVKKRDDLGNLFIKMVTITALLVLPIFMGLAAVADPFVTIAFGDKFAPSAEFMAISAFTMFPGVVAWFLPNLLIASGKTNDAFKLTLLNLISNILVAGATIWFGIKFMLISLVVASFISLPIRIFIVNKHVSIDSKRLFSSLVPPSFSALSMYFLLIAIKPHITNWVNSDVLSLILLIASGALIYPFMYITLFFGHAKVQLNELKEMLASKKR